MHALSHAKGVIETLGYIFEAVIECSKQILNGSYWKQLECKEKELLSLGQLYLLCANILNKEVIIYKLNRIMPGEISNLHNADR